MQRTQPPGHTSVIRRRRRGPTTQMTTEVIQRLHDAGDHDRPRSADNRFAQGHRPGAERLRTLSREPAPATPCGGMNGAGEGPGLVCRQTSRLPVSRARPRAVMESELEPIVELLAENALPFRIHATTDRDDRPVPDRFERPNGRQPFRTRLIIDHARDDRSAHLSTGSPREGGGICDPATVKWPFQGEYVVGRYGRRGRGADAPGDAGCWRPGVPGRRRFPGRHDGSTS